MSMIIRGINFGSIWDDSGARNFFGEGYRHHPVWRLMGLTFEGVTFVAKAATLLPRYPDDSRSEYRGGNLRLDRHTHQPVELYPKCVIYDFLRDQSWDASGLTNPGVRTLFEDGRWQWNKEPFWISFTPVGDTGPLRMREARLFCDIAKRYLPDFHAPCGLQINLQFFDQLNDPGIWNAQVSEFLDIFCSLNIPIIIKINVATIPVECAMVAENHPACDGVCLSERISAGWRGIDWWRRCDTRNCAGGIKYESPLKKFGGGTFSGPEMVPIVAAYIRQLREKGFSKHINGGNGIRRERHAREIILAGADSIFISTSATTRPWRMKNIIKTAHFFCREL